MEHMFQSKKKLSQVPKCNESWLSKESWTKLKNLGKAFGSNRIDIVLSELRNSLMLKTGKTGLKTDNVEELNLPLSSDDIASNFGVKIVVIWSLRPERFLRLADIYVSAILGQNFFSTNDINKIAVQKDLIERSILVIFNKRSEVGIELANIAKKHRILCTVQPVGKGQHANLREKIEAAVIGGSWVILECCHVDTHMLWKIYNTFNDIQNKSFIHVRFRLWFCIKSGHSVPKQMLNNCLRFAFEAPEAVRSSIDTLHTLGSIVSDAYFDINHPHWLDMLYALSFYHSILIRRSEIGKAGFQLPYEFEKDFLSTSLQCSQNSLRVLKRIRIPIGLDYDT